MWHEQDERHDGSAQSQRKLPGHSQAHTTMNKVARETSPEQTANARCSVRNPGQSANGLDIKAACVI